MVACSVKVEVAFNAGFGTAAGSRTWTDVSARVFGTVSITWGRSDQFATCEPLTCSLSLANEDGALTPGNASSPYYPNVKLDRPIRVTVTPVGGSASVRFVGYVDAWPRAWPGGTDAGAVYANITATSRTGRLGERGTKFYSDVIEYSIASSAVAVFPCDEPDGARMALSVNSDHELKPAGRGAKVRFNGASILLRGGQHLTSFLTLGTDYSIALSFLSTTRGGRDILPIQLQQDASTLGAANDGVWHRLVMTLTGGTTAGFTLYLDGAAIPYAITAVRTSNLTLGLLDPSARIRDVAVYDSELTSGDVTTDYDAFNGGYADLPNTRLVRYAAYVGIAAGEVDADTGTPLMGATDIEGMSAVDAFRVCESTEGGVLTDARDGSLRLIGRGARYYSSPTVTLDMEAEEVSADYSPTLDRFSLRNDVTGTNAATSMGQIGGGEGYSRNVTDAASVAQYGTSGASVEVNAVEDSEAVAAAGWMVQSWAEPADRVPSLTVDLYPLSLAQTAAAMAVFVGSRVTVTNRTAQDATSSAAFFAEGGSETWTADGGTLTFNLSPLGLNDSVMRLDVGDHLDTGLHCGR